MLTPGPHTRSKCISLIGDPLIYLLLSMLWLSFVFIKYFAFKIEIVTPWMSFAPLLFLRGWRMILSLCPSSRLACSLSTQRFCPGLRSLMWNVSWPKINDLTQEKGKEFSSMLTSLPIPRIGLHNWKVRNRNQRNSLVQEVSKIDSPAGLQSMLFIGPGKPFRAFKASCFVFPSVLL